MKREEFQSFLRGLTDAPGDKEKANLFANRAGELTDAQRSRALLLVPNYAPDAPLVGVHPSTQAPPGSMDGDFSKYAVHGDGDVDTSSIVWGADMDVDPYGTGITIVANAVQAMHERSGQMSVDEHVVVCAIGYLLHMLDDASAPRSFQGIEKVEDLKRVMAYVGVPGGRGCSVDGCPEKGRWVNETGDKAFCDKHMMERLGIGK